MAPDPASMCGPGLSTLTGLHSRIASTHLVYHGSKLVLISRRQGKSLDILVGPKEPRLAEYFTLFKDLLTREFNPLRKIFIETINNEPSTKSPYAEALRRFGFRSARNALELWKEY